MSGIAAILRFDGKPPDPQALRRMTEAMGYRGPDGIRHWVGDSAALGHCLMHTTAESLDEAQPLADETGKLHLVMDGWLANPQELRDALRARGIHLRYGSDAELVLSAYRAWGEDCCDRIDGEWAFLVWNEATRTALVARDHVGLRPLHWHWDGRRLLVASDIAGILAAGDIDARLNTGMIVEHLAMEWLSRDETLWQGVMRLPSANAMIVDGNGPRIRRYWMPPLEVSLRYPREEDYVEHYRELFADSVRRASRTHLPLACEVSGGLDSSAVFALALRAQAAGRLLAPSLHGYTYSFPSGGPEDESEYADAVAEHLGVSITKVKPFLPNVDWFVERARADRDMPCYPNVAMMVNTGKAVAADGARVVLNGEGGDNYQGGLPHYFAEHLIEGDLRSLIRSAREDAAVLGWAETLSRFWRYGIGPLLPKPAREARKHRLISGKATKSLLSAQSAELLRKRRLNASLAPKAAPAQRTLFARLNDPIFGYMCEYLTRERARGGNEVRSPMASRAMVEFSFSTPQRLRVRGHFDKHIHREAMAGLLPEKVVRRRSKAHFDFAFERILDKELTTMINGVLQCNMGEFVDSSGLRDWEADYFESRTGDRRVYEMWAVFGLAVLKEIGSAESGKGF